jgi:hypothetical protein
MSWNADSAPYLSAIPEPKVILERLTQVTREQRLLRDLLRVAQQRARYEAHDRGEGAARE